MSQPERLNMAGDASSAETGKGATAVLEKPAGKPNVVKVSEEGISPPKGIGEWIRRRLGPPEIQVLVNPDEESIPDEPFDAEESPDGGGDQPPGGEDGGDGAGEGGGREPEGPLEPPEGFRSFDWEGNLEVLWSPEFRAEMWDTTEQLSIIEAWPTELKYDGGETERYFNDLFKYWKYLEYLDNKRSFESKPFTPADFKQIKTTLDTPEAPNQPEDELADLQPFRVVFERYQSFHDSEDQVSRYFNEMRRMKLLNGIDDSMKSIYGQIMEGMESEEINEEGRVTRRRMDKDQIMDRVEKARAAMVRSAGRALETLKRSDPTTIDLTKLNKLEGGLEAYIELGIGRFDLLLAGEGLVQPPGIDGEFDFMIADVGPESAAALRRLAAEREIFWRPTWANYFEVTARIPEQFQIAVETFIRWMRTGLGKDPEDLFQKVNGFKEALTSAGQRAGPDSQQKTVELRLLLEILMGVIGADFSNEQYKAANFKAFWQFAAKNEGPARMLQLAKAFRGILPVVLHKLDKDITLELLHSPHGSEGQLMGRGRNAIEMADLQKQRMAILTAEIMGIAMKGYHPDDSEQILDTNMYERNLTEITKFKSDEYFENLYEGFDPVQQEALLRQLELNPLIQNIKFAKLVDEHAFIGPLTPEQTQFYQNWKSGDLVKSIQQAEQNIKFARWVQAQIDKGEQPELDGKWLQIYNDWKDGTLARPPIALSQLQAWERLDRASRIQQFLAAGNNSDKLTGEDKIMYEEAKNTATLAYELYGAMGEKAKRGGGVFLAERRNAEGHRFFDYIPNFWAEKGGHFVENWTKATYGGELDQQLLDQIKAERKAAGEAQLRNHNLSAEQRRQIQQWMNPKALLADEVKYRVDQARRWYIWSLKIHGTSAKFWDFTLLKDGRAVDPNTLGYTRWGVNRKSTNPIDRHRYAVPENPRILGYNSDGKGVILVFDKDGKPITGESTGLKFDDKTGKALIYDQPKAVIKLVRGQRVAELPKLIEFDNLNKDTEARPMELKIPKGDIDQSTGKMIVKGDPEKIHVDFDSVRLQLADHPYSRWTGHPYWGYQEEDTGLILSAEAIDAARKIKAGLLRPQDAPPHAVQLLIVDPTLERFGHFDLENLEAVIGLAAVEESYQAHWRIGDELYLNFFPADASRLQNHTAYILQDHGGSTKQWFHFRAESALWPDSRTRRLRTFIPYIPLHFTSMSEMWGAPGGALDVFRMMGYEKYRMVGQFAMDKWVNQTGGAQDVYEAVADWYDEQAKRLREGLGRKLNNESDRLRKFYKQYSLGSLGNLPDIKTSAEDVDEEYLQTFRDTLNRPEVLAQRITVLESLMRGERSPLWLEGIEIYQRRPDGSYILDADGYRILNSAVNTNTDSGSSRHTNKLYIYRYARLARSDQPGEGVALYPAEAIYYELGDYYTLASMRVAKKAKDAGNPNWESFLETRWEWFEGKANN